MCRAITILCLLAWVGHTHAQSDRSIAPPTESPIPIADSCDLRDLGVAPEWSFDAEDAVIAAVRQSNACLAQADEACVESTLASVSTQNVGDNGKALLAMQHAALATSRGDVDAAVAIYEEARGLTDIDAALRRDIAYRIALIMSSKRNYAAAIRVLTTSFSCDTWTANALAVRAMAYQGLWRDDLAIDNLAGALRLYELEGTPAPAGLEKNHEHLLANGQRTFPEGNGPFPASKVPPNYPPDSMSRGSEGWAEVEFDVSEQGEVENIRAVDSSQKSFEAPTVASVLQWRYTPRFEAGIPVAARDVSTIVRYKLR